MLIDPVLFIEQAIANTVTALQADRTLIQEWFAFYPAARIAEITRFIEGWKQPDIKPAFAKENREAPTISVLGIEGSEINWELGGSFGVDEVPDSNRSRDQQGSFWSVGADISVFGVNADHALYLRHLVVGALYMYRDDFDRLTLNNLSISYGRLIPDSKTLAAFAYRYTVTAKFDTVMQVPKYYGDTPSIIVGGGDGPDTLINDEDPDGVHDDPPSGYSY